MDHPMPTTATTAKTANKPAHCSRKLLRVVLCLACFCMPAAHNAQAQDLLRLTFSEGAAAAPGYSTRAPLVLSVMDGQELILERASGRDYQLEAAPASWSWTQVQQIPRNSSALKITPSRKNNTVQLQISYRSREADDVLSYSTTVSGVLGEWIVLVSDGQADTTAGGRRYSTASVANELAVKVELAGP